MNLIKTKGVPGIRGHMVLRVFFGLLLSVTVCQAAKSPEDELSHLKLRFDSLKNSYKLLCNQYSNLAANRSAPGLTCTECPPEWFQVGDHCFILGTDKQDFQTSSTICAQSGGTLASLTTREHHEAVEKESRRIGGFDTHYWIGLNDVEKEGDWRWADNSTLTNQFWDTIKQEPDNNKSGGPEGENCVVVNGYSQDWYDVPCSFKYRYICQKNATLLH